MRIAPERGAVARRPALQVLLQPFAFGWNLDRAVIAQSNGFKDDLILSDR
jgi:hypothetical protein